MSTSLLLAALAMMPPSQDLDVLPLRERAALQDSWLGRRLETVLPTLMRREGIDLWIVAAREYNEDPVISTMLPARWLSARRRTILAFHDPGGDQPVDRVTVSRYDLEPYFRNAWDQARQPDQWAALAALVEQWDPQRIAVDRSPTFALADGLSASEHDALREALPASLRSRLVSAERLAIGWLETRIPEEMEWYPRICRLAHRIIADGFHPAVVKPGVTTTEDLEWWYRERIREWRLGEWFHPTVSLQRAETKDPEDASRRPPPETIQAGDLLHVDLGITYLGLNSDTQQHAYVLRPGEAAAPEGLCRALRAGNRMQDILTGQFRAGRTGNEVLAAALAQAGAEHLAASVYTHPLGFHGHAAGATIGLWDQQGGVPGPGDHPLGPDTVWSIELNVRVPLPEWGGQEIRIMLEEDAFFDGRSVEYLDGRQREPILIDPGRD